MERVVGEPLETVLVVDDSSVSRRILALTLEEAGYTVLEAEDGLEALEVYGRTPVPVVVTDIAMPRLDGLQLLARLREASPSPEVVLLTAKRADDAAAAIQALRLGAHDYLSKDAAEGEALVLAVRRAAERRRLIDQNQALLEELRRLSLTDPVTSVSNRRAFDESLRQDIARARRSGASLALVMLDLDHFKRVNDTLGHPVGDEMLRAFAGRLRSLAREGDRVFRHGGEEFAVVLGDTDLAGAARLAARLVAATAAQPFDLSTGPLEMTCSAGVAALEAGDDLTGAALMVRADSALYRAKREGRNRSCSGSGSGVPEAPKTP
jgi:two-component system, cell cycle response regulator